MTVDLTILPGGDLIEQGLADLAAGRRSAPACLVCVGGERLVRAGLAFPSAWRPMKDPELSLYEILCAQGDPDPYSRYNALIRQLLSFAQALERG